LKDKASALEMRQKELAKSLEAAELKSRESSKEVLTIISGDKGLLQKTDQMIENASEEYVGIWSELGIRDVVDSGTAQKLAAAKSRGVRIRVIADVGSQSFIMANYLARFAEVRRSRNLLFYMDIIDRKEMVFGPSFPIADENRRWQGRELNIFTNNNRFVSGMYVIFEKIWRVSPKYIPKGVSKKHAHS
jgi:sugar-specific transcriptional regulator TrmB